MSLSPRLSPALSSGSTTAWTRKSACLSGQRRGCGSWLHMVSPELGSVVLRLYVAMAQLGLVPAPQGVLYPSPGPSYFLAKGPEAPLSLMPMCCVYSQRVWQRWPWETAHEGPLGLHTGAFLQNQKSWIWPHRDSQSLPLIHLGVGRQQARA